ncbi:PREDICTED: cyclic nucleotide-gated ion channel 1-like [Fragaria vesca subsp. vesca]
MASSVHFQSHQLNGSVQVQMDEESIDHAIFVPGNSISKIEEEPKLRKQHSEDMSNIDMPILYIAKKILYTVFLIPAVLLVAIISPDESQYFIFSSFISMLLDPLFLYIPLINEERKCLMLDKKLMTAALILRIVTDLRYVMKIGSKTIKCRRCPKKIAGSIATDVVAILPIPQVLGTFWYFFSIQREIDCWNYACHREFRTHCDANAVRNVTFLKVACPINPPDAAKFDFGIFLYALQSGVQESTNVPQKLLLCFSWGLQNLSSFGSNLKPSTYGWETLFVVAISISGLVLFIYFLGHVQTFMQIAGKSERSRQKWNKILEPKIRSMLPEYGLTDEVKKSIENVVKMKDLDDPDFLLENMFSIFSFKHEVEDQTLQVELTSIRNSLFLEKLKRFSGLHMNKLKEICKHLDPVVYSKGKYIIREGEPLDMMFFITQGIALTYATDRSITTERLEKGECFGGDRLMTWAATASTSFSDLPNSRKTVKAHKNVELFALRAADLQRILSQPSSHFSNEGTHSDGYIETKVIQTVLSRLRDYVIKPRWLTTHG